MGRYGSGGSYDHSCTSWGHDFLIAWTVDYYAKDRSRGRYPRRFEMWTGKVGARRFCKKWDIPLPENLSKEKDEVE